MTKPYCSRVWIVQEALLPHKLKIWLGEYRIDADELRELFLSFDITPHILPGTEPISSISGLKLVECRRDFWKKRNPNSAFWRSSREWPWEYKLRWLLESFAT
jgi:hypothetical protein